MISTLTLALSAFNDIDVRAISVGKSNSEYYHVFYRKNNVLRVMLVPRNVDSFEQLQSEVKILIERNEQSQSENGSKDGKQ